MNTTSTFHFRQPEDHPRHIFTSNNNNNYISASLSSSVNIPSCYYEGQQRHRAAAFFHAGSESPSTAQNYECDEEESQYSLSEFSHIHLADGGDQQHLANGHASPTSFANHQHQFHPFNQSGVVSSCLPTSTADYSSQDLGHLNESGTSSQSSNRKRALSFSNGTNTGSTPNGGSPSASSTDKRAATKICRVCGDKAYSYNFNVITCESCKAFFRRNANKEKEIRCPFNEQCDINIVSRRFCQRCRLQKCFRVGMKKEWIMSEEARLEKKQRIQDNRERRMAERTNQGEGSAEEMTCSATATAVPLVSPMEMLIANAVENSPTTNNNPTALLVNAAAAQQQTSAAAPPGPALPTLALPATLGLPKVNAPSLMQAAVEEVNNTGLVSSNAVAHHQLVAAAAAAAVSSLSPPSLSQAVEALLPPVVDGLNHQPSAAVPTITTAASSSSTLCSFGDSSVAPSQSVVSSTPSFGQIASSLPPTMLPNNHSADAALAALTSNIQQQSSSATTVPATTTHPLLMAQQQAAAAQHHQQQLAQLQAAAAVQAAQLQNATNAQLHEQQVLIQQHQASQFLQAQAHAQSQQQQAAVVAAQLQQQQIAAAVAASQCIPVAPSTTMVHSMLQPSAVVDLVAGQQHSTNVGGQAGMVVPPGAIVSSGAANLTLTAGVPNMPLQQTAFGVNLEHHHPSVASQQQTTLLAPMLNAQMETGAGGNTQQPHHHSNPPAAPNTNSSQEMIAIPKDVLMKLVEHRIENDQQQQQQQMEAAKPVKCQCRCQCGRYPNELLIVDKVMTDLLENSSKQYNNEAADSRGGGNRLGCSSVSSSNSFRMESNSSVNSNATPTSFLSNGGTNTQKGSLCGFEEQKVNPADYCNLTLNDQENLNELLRSNALWNSEAGETQYGVTENGLRRLIRMISSVSGFRILDRYDQTLLLKYGCESYFVLRGTSSYNDTKISYLLQNRVSDNIINFYKDFPVEWRNSETVIPLLGMILLFDPQIPELHNQLSVTVENMKYVLLLKHVLFTLCSQDISRSAQVFNELICRLEQLKTIGTLCQTENFEPIVQQMFEPQVAPPSSSAIDTIIGFATSN